jgi:hypothetical protein
MLDPVEAEETRAEELATGARAKARRLWEEKLVALAKEEGRRLGMHKGQVWSKCTCNSHDDAVTALRFDLALPAGTFLPPRLQT